VKVDEGIGSVFGFESVMSGSRDMSLRFMTEENRFLPKYRQGRFQDSRNKKSTRRSSLHSSCGVNAGTNTRT
jgi:hypothetical protein